MAAINLSMVSQTLCTTSESIDSNIKPNKGFVVGFSFTGEVITEISQFFKRTGKVIVPLTVREILDEEIAQKLA